MLGVMTAPAGAAAEANLLLCNTREIRDVLESRHVPGVRYSLGLRADMDAGLADYGKDGSSIVLTRP